MPTYSELCIVSQYGEGGYAIPIQYVERCILVPLTSLKQQTLCIDGEDTTLIMLCDKSFSDYTQDLDAMCILCRKATKGLVAVCLGNTLHGRPSYLAELPIYSPAEDSKKSRLGKELESGFYIVEQTLPGGRQLSILRQHGRDSVCTA